MKSLPVQNKPSASEIRLDPLTGQFVLIAPERMLRPGAFRPSQPVGDDICECPFCAGHEAETPDPIRVYSASDMGSKWLVRVIPNRYPAVRMEQNRESIQQMADANAAFADEASGAAKTGLKSGADADAVFFQRFSGSGYHEVVIESPDHDRGYAELAAPGVALTWRAYRDRFLEWRQDRRIRCGLAFKNHGSEAGASLSHPHSQLIALGVVPPGLQMELDRSRRHRHSRKVCLLCDTVAREREGPRVVAVDKGFIAWCPFASGVPYELWIAPLVHHSHFELDEAVRFTELGEVLQASIRRLENVMPDLSFNLVLQTSPFDIPLNRHYHWHVRVLPRVVRKAGFEWYTGCQINPVPPEVAAQALRNA